MTSTTLALFFASGLPGTWVAAAGLSAGVSAEALAARWMTVRLVRKLAGQAPDDGISYRAIVRFYTPLALTSLISLAAQPMATFFVARGRAPLESLAVLPVVNSLSFIFRALGLSYQEVSIALLGRGARNWPLLARFGTALGLGSSLAMALIVFTPLTGLWFGTLSGLSSELTRFALPPARILVLLPAFSVLLSIQRAILVHGRDTTPITWATAIEIGGIAAALTLCIGPLGMVGATAAAIAFLVGRWGGNLYLAGPCAAVLRASAGSW